MKKRWVSLLLVLFMLAAAMPAGIQLYAQEDKLTEYVSVTFENMEVTDTFENDLSDIDASYIAEDSKMKVVGPEYSLLGTRSLAVNQCDMYWQTIGANDQEYYIDLSVKADADFNNTLSVVFSSKQPSMDINSIESVELTAFTVTNQDGKGVIVDTTGNIITEMEEDVRYSIRCIFTRGSDSYDILINSEKVSDDCRLSYPVYTVDSMAIKVNTVSSGGSGNAEIIENPYIIIDNITIASKGRYYPQKFSSQEQGRIPEVIIPEDTQSDSIRIFINTTEIAMSNDPVQKNGTVYIDAEQIMRCIGMEIQEEKSNKTFGFSNENVAVKATLNSNEVLINGEICTLSAPPQKISGKIMVTPNFICQTLNAKVWWDESGKLLVITTGSYKKDGILRNIGGKLFMNGEPYYEISFNKFDLFEQILAYYEPDSEYPSEDFTLQAAEEALKQLRESGFRSIRVYMFSDIYQDLMYSEEHQETYFKAMDQLFDLCDKYSIKVVVCLGLTETFLLKKEFVEEKGWIAGTETINELISDSTSESRKNVYWYIEQIVTRYKNRDTVLMWEIGNEGNLNADIGSSENRVTYSLIELAGFYSDCADKIRKFDKKHLISSGDSVLLSSQWNLLTDVLIGGELKWNVDTEEDRLKALALLNEKLDVISVHAYGLGTLESSQYKDVNGNTLSCSFSMYMKEAKRLGKILYNGATNSNEALDSTDFYKDTSAYISSIIESGVQLSHWWTFRSDRASVNDDYLWRIDSGELFDAIVNANNTLNKKYAVNNIAEENVTDIWADPAFEVFDSAKVIDGKEFVQSASFRSKMIRLAVLCCLLLVAGSAGVFALTREKLNRKRKKDIV